MSKKIFFLFYLRSSVGAYIILDSNYFFLWLWKFYLHYFLVSILLGMEYNLKSDATRIMDKRFQPPTPHKEQQLDIYLRIKIVQEMLRSPLKILQQHSGAKEFMKNCTKRVERRFPLACIISSPRQALLAQCQNQNSLHWENKNESVSFSFLKKMLKMEGAGVSQQSLWCDLLLH